MSTTLTIRNLDATVKHKLRQRAALHHRSMEAEAREILAASLADPMPGRVPSDEMKKRLEAMRGIWKDRAGGKSTDEIMRELRAED